MHRSTSFARRAALLSVGVALVALGVGLAPVDAQSAPVFSVSPSSATVGDTLTLSASGCVAEGVDQADLEVFVYVEGFDIGDSFPTDADGAMSFVTPPLDADTAGEQYVFAATCTDLSGEEPVVVFRYDQIVTVSVAAPATATTTPAPAAPIAVAPSFTG